ncbi:MAG: hypothetical protein JJU28_09290 [Cyclobacteriaceae bacterium]|nr:hypothetical protein [Cyclobacteriaceae bacterium]
METTERTTEVKLLLIFWVAFIAVGTLCFSKAYGQEPSSEMFLLARNGFEPVIAPVYFEKVEASAIIGDKGDLLLRMQYTHFAVRTKRNSSTNVFLSGDMQVQVKILLSNQEVFNLSTKKPVTSFYESKNMAHPSEDQESVLQGFSMLCAIPLHMLEQIKKTPVVEVQIEYTSSQRNVFKTRSIFADGREVQAKKSERQTIAEVYRQGWLNLIEYYTQLDELVRGT